MPTEEECMRTMWMTYAQAHAERCLRAGRVLNDDALAALGVGADIDNAEVMAGARRSASRGAEPEEGQ